MTMTQMSAFVAALGDNNAWDRVVFDRPTTIAAREWLHGELRDLELQRVQKREALDDEEYRKFEARQAGYERLVNRRLSATTLSGYEDAAPGLAAQVADLHRVVGLLAGAIDDYLEEKQDEGYLDDLLGDLRVRIGDSDIELRDAIAKVHNYRTGEWAG